MSTLQESVLPCQYPKAYLAFRCSVFNSEPVASPGCNQDVLVPLTQVAA